MTAVDLPLLLSRFPFNLPSGYRWLIERGLVGFEANSALQPWHFLPREEVFSLSERWPRGCEFTRIVAFARRQDCDDLACFAMKPDTTLPIVLVVHGWTSDGYEEMARFESIWDWFRSAIVDVEEWIRLGHEYST